MSGTKLSITLLKRKHLCLITLLRLMYERIGAYTRKNLIHMYFDEERKFNNRVASLYKIYKHNIKKFNEIMQSDFKSDFTPGKSLEIFKVFFRCQLPYEMFVSLVNDLHIVCFA
jgi:hypothetical protein